MNKSRKIFLLLLIPLIFLSLSSFWVEKEITAMYLSNNSIFEDIRFSTYDEAQAVYLHENEDSKSYHAYMSGSPNAQLKVYFQHCTGIIIDGIELSDGDTIPSIIPEVPYLVQAYDWNHTIFEEGYVTFYFSDTIPSMHITTESGDMDEIHSDKEHSETASYSCTQQMAKWILWAAAPLKDAVILPGDLNRNLTVLIYLTMYHYWE